MVYFASEALVGAGTDMNGDGDTADEVAVAVMLAQATEVVLGAAALDCAVVGSEVYLVVDEVKDNRDWNGANGLGDVVLLHWSLLAGVLTYVDTIDPDTEEMPVIAVEDHLFYASETVPTGGSDETSLRRIAPALPTIPVVVENAIGGGTLQPRLLGDDRGLLFLSLDESTEGVDLNGDTDTTDEYVLALLNGGDDGERIFNTGAALADESAPFAAYPTATDDWLVAFLVDENFQGQGSLNPLSLSGQMINPDSCSTADIDSADQVLHFLEVQDFIIGGTVKNTGLVGRDRVVAINGYVATLSYEGDAECDINEDGDTNDTVVRWTGIDTVMPPRQADQLHAIENGIPGGSHGLAALGERFIAIVDEGQDSQNIDLRPANNDLVGWLDPDDGFGADWTFAHESGNPSHGTGLMGEPYAGAAWMAEKEEGGRLPIAFQEEVPAMNLNNFSLDCTAITKDSDSTDALPIWLDFEGGPTLDFDGVGFALRASNSGIVVARGFVYFRVDEAADATDYNLDGDRGDVILLRNPISSCDPQALATSHEHIGPVIITDGQNGAAFLASELLAGVDFNNDGDASDTVVRYFMLDSPSPPPPDAECSWYCGSGTNMDTYTVFDPYVIGGTFQASVGLSYPNLGAVIAGYLGQLTFPIWGQQGLVNVGTSEVMGLPSGWLTNPVVITWPVPGDPAYAGFHVFTQAAGFGGGQINLTCAYDCTVGY